MNSRRKGSKNERLIAKALEDWTNKKFAKTPASGGLGWKKANVAGDVVCTTEGHYFPFCVEGKFYNKIDFSHLLNPNIKKVDILEFWAQCKRDADKANKIPMLLMRYNGLPKNFWFLAIETEFYSKLPMLPRMTNCTSTLKYWNSKTNIKITIMPSGDFFKLPYKEIKLLAKQILKQDAKTKETKSKA